jgi:hypothetical protein
MSLLEKQHSIDLSGGNMEVRLIDRKTGTSKIVTFSWAQIQIERMYAAPDRILNNLKAGIPLVTDNWVYELYGGEKI